MFQSSIGAAAGRKPDRLPTWDELVEAFQSSIGAAAGGKHDGDSHLDSRLRVSILDRRRRRSQAVSRSKRSEFLRVSILDRRRRRSQALGVWHLRPRVPVSILDRRRRRSQEPRGLTRRRSHRVSILDRRRRRSQALRHRRSPRAATSFQSSIGAAAGRKRGTWPASPFSSAFQSLIGAAAGRKAMAHLYELRAEVVSILDRRRRRSQAGKRQVLTMCVPIAVSILDRRRRRSQVGEGHREFSSSSGFQSSIGAAAGRKADVCRPATGHECFNPRSAPPPVARIHLAHGMAGRLARFQSSIGAAAGRKPADRGGALMSKWFQSSIGAAAGRK